MLIDDSPEERNLFGEILDLIDESINYIPFATAQTALAYLENSTNQPDYIFLDVNMPGMDGLECLREIKMLKKAKHVPVIMYSTAHPSVYMQSAFALGASQCLAKKVSILESVDEISAIIQHLEKEKH